MSLFPINVQIDGRQCVVIGGGKVALRKTRGLLQAGGEVRVVSSKLVAELRALVSAKSVEWIDRDYVEGDLQGVFLAFAATDNPAVQAQIVREASRCSVLINVADDPQASHFHVPAHFRRGRMLVSVSTGGASPALSRRFRQDLEKRFTPEYEGVVELMAIIRRRVLERDDDTTSHTALFRRLLEKQFVELVLNGQWFELQMLLIEELPDTVDAVQIMQTFVDGYDCRE